MSKIFKIYILALVFLNSASISFSQETPFNKGVNLSGWFQQDNVQSVQFTRYTKQDFENIKSLGCDAIRLPIALHEMTDGAPSYNLDPIFGTLLNQIMDWAEELEIYLIIDNHSFDPTGNTELSIENILTKVWPALAEICKERSEYIIYEIKNEPHDIADADWGAIQGNVIDAIREVDQTHAIVVGPANWNSLWNLPNLPEYEDDNLIYTFHFYDPFLFTHQGASWVGPSMTNVTDIPFPYDETTMPVMPAEYAGTWIGSGYDDYSANGNVDRIHFLIDKVADFKATRNVPVYCGEFGVYQPNSDEQDRVYWYEQVRNYLEEKGIGWTIWDYHGGFGLFNEGGQGLFEHDFNTAMGEALGLTPPPQTPFEIKPDSTGFIIYDDFIGEKMLQSGWQDGELTLYSTDAPNYGEHCIHWTGATQYKSVGFDFVPDRDLSYLKDNGYAMNLFVRGDVPGTSYDLRFYDTKTDDPEDHPWRMNTTIHEYLDEGDLHWKRIRVPLEFFYEGGSWDNNQWYPAEDKFDWTRVDGLYFVSEHSDLAGVNLWFDDVIITEMDTAMVTDTSAFISNLHDLSTDDLLSIYPNPAQDYISFHSNQPTKSYTLEIYNASGKRVLIQDTSADQIIDISSMPVGMYVVRVKDDGNWLGSLRMVRME